MSKRFDYRLSRLHKVMTHIDSRLDQPLQLDELAGVACYSPYHFDRVFLQYRGVSPSEHVRRRRLQRAANRLRHEPDRPIGAIALDCGYTNQANFSRAFQAQFGMSPREWRQGGWRRFMDQVVAQDETLRPEHPRMQDERALEARLRAGVAARICERRLPPMRTLTRQFVGLPFHQLETESRALVEQLFRDGAAQPGDWFVGSFLDDPGFTGREHFIYEFGLISDKQADAGSSVLQLAGGQYACLDWEGEAPLMRWMYEDWLDRHASWAMDSNRPHLNMLQVGVDGVLRGTLAIPIRARTRR